MKPSFAPSRPRRALLALVPLAASALALPAMRARAADSPPAKSFSANVAIEWFELATRLTQLTPGNSPPVASRSFAYMAVALHEAVITGMPDHVSLAGQLNDLYSLPPTQPDEVYHWPTVAHAALATMVRMMYPNATNEMRARIDTLERDLPLKHAADFEAARLDVERGIRSTTHGKLLAMAVMTWARTDGGHEHFLPARALPSRYLAPSGPGKWVPTPPVHSRGLLPFWGRNRPFVLKTGMQCLPPAPPQYSEEPDSAFYREADEVWITSRKATTEQRQVALYWADDPIKTPTPGGHWIYILNDLLRERRATLDVAAQAYAQTAMAMSDAFLACWAAKYHYNLVRPVTYAQQVFDSQWVPPLLETPPFPEYPSGHSAQSSAAATALTALFGDNVPFTDNTHNDRGWGPRRFESFNKAADEAAVSRLYGGIHYRSGIDQGQAQGRCVAQAVLGLKWKR